MKSVYEENVSDAVLWFCMNLITVPGEMRFGKGWLLELKGE